MRLTESLIKVIFAKAIESEKVEELNAAFVKHLAMDHTFQKVKDEPGGLRGKRFLCLAISATISSKHSQHLEAVQLKWPYTASCMKSGQTLMASNPLAMQLTSHPVHKLAVKRENGAILCRMLRTKTSSQLFVDCGHCLPRSRDLCAAKTLKTLSCILFLSAAGHWGLGGACCYPAIGATRTIFIPS